MSRVNRVALPNIPYRALAAADRRTILEKLGHSPRITMPETGTAYHIHVPMLADEGLVVVDGDELTRGPRFESTMDAMGVSVA